MFATIVGNSLAFLALTIVCCLPGLDQVSFYISILVLVLFSSVFSAVLEAGIFNIIGQFPTKYTQAYISGHGVAGVVVITVSIASYFIAGTFSNERFAEYYFGMSTALIILSFFFFWIAQSNPFYTHYNRIVEEVAVIREHEVEENLAQIKDCATFMEVFLEVREIAIATFLSATIGFIIFPEFMFSTKSVYCGTPQETWFHRDMFVNLALLLANIFDLIGKLLPLIPVFSFQSGPYILLALSRSVMIPLYLFGNIKIKGYRLPFKPYLANDILFHTLISLSALTASYLGTVCMMWAPARVKPKERSLAIAVVILCGACGFMLGTLISMFGKHMLIKYSTPA